MAKDKTEGTAMGTGAAAIPAELRREAELDTLRARIKVLEGCLRTFANMPFEPNREDGFVVYTLCRGMGTSIITNGDIRQARSLLGM